MEDTKLTTQTDTVSDNVVTMPTTNNDVVDIDLSAIRKKRFRIDGDDNRILELNTSDLGVINRLDEVYPKLKAHESKVAKLTSSTAELGDLDSDSEEESMKAIQKTSNALREIDKDMRELIDYIFNANVSATCGCDGSMYDPIDGRLRYEHIIDKIMPLYETNFANETRKVRERVAKATKKYTKR